MSLRLSKEHGLNPTIPVCFLCGKEKGEIALLGASYKGEAPMHMCIDKSPCDKCKEHMKQGIILVGVRDGEKKTSPDNPYRTGQFYVITEEAAKRMFGEIPPQRAAFIEESALKQLNFPGMKNEKSDIPAEGNKV